MTATPAPGTGYQLDRDLVADQVSLQSNGLEKRIRISFGDLRRREVGFTTQTQDSGALVARDIDRDGDVDIIWLGNAAQHAAVVLINQGAGDFVEADTAPFSNELDELFNIGDPPDKRLGKHRRRDVPLPSSSFSDIAPQPKVDFHLPTITGSHISEVKRIADRSAFLTRLTGRGPPTLLY